MDVKARFDTTCECCKSPITPGDRVITFYGRIWLTAHVIRYQQQRRVRAVPSTHE